MSHNLLAISIGPIQDFIYSARRTRDLWFGSWVLSEISKAAAVKVAQLGGRLIFPPSKPGEDDLIANIILAEIVDCDPQQIATAAEEAARLCWIEQTDKAFRRVSGFVDKTLWDEQKDDVLEFYAAWGPAQVRGSYAQARTEVMRLLAGRKSIRDFKPSAFTGFGIPKSSLDPGRESVLVREDFDDRLSRTLRMNRGEKLDVVGLTKRLSRVEFYPSVSRVAADPWLRGIQAWPKHREVLLAACKLIPPDVLMPANWEQYDRTFPFDGTIIYRNRHQHYEKDLRADRGQLDRVEAALEPLYQLNGIPSPYYALLVADGDRMGGIISSLDSPEDHRAFSALLGRFSGQVKRITEECGGCYVFSGGDDVLVFVPVDKAVACATQLREAFDTAIAPVLKSRPKLLKPETRPSLSVGIAIAHFMEPLEDVLHWARAAEKHAKQGFHEAGKRYPDRNGLAIHLHTRGGAPIFYRRQWTESPAARIESFIGGFLSKVLPHRAPFALREMLKHASNWSDSSRLTAALRREAALVIEKKSTLEFAPLAAEIKSAFEIMDDPADLELLINEILIARHIAGVGRQSDKLGPPRAPQGVAA